MATKKKKSAVKAIGKKVGKTFREKVLPSMTPGGIVKKAGSLLTKAEKIFKTKLKRGIKENIDELAKFNKKTGKAGSSERKALRLNLRDLGKIEGEKKAARFAQERGAAVFKKPKISKAKPRARVKASKKKK